MGIKNFHPAENPRMMYNKVYEKAQESQENTNFLYCKNRTVGYPLEIADPFSDVFQ
jgi:hypothetical protein